MANAGNDPTPERLIAHVIPRKLRYYWWYVPSSGHWPWQASLASWLEHALPKVSHVVSMDAAAAVLNGEP